MTLICVALIAIAENSIAGVANAVAVAETSFKFRGLAAGSAGVENLIAGSIEEVGVVFASRAHCFRALAEIAIRYCEFAEFANTLINNIIFLILMFDISKKKI